MALVIKSLLLRFTVPNIISAARCHLIALMIDLLISQFINKTLNSLLLILQFHL